MARRHKSLFTHVGQTANQPGTYHVYPLVPGQEVWRGEVIVSPMAVYHV